MIDAIPEAFADDSCWGPEQLEELVGRLAKQGVDKKQLMRIADNNYLGDCSYGSCSRINLINGAVWGVLLGAGAGYVSDGICKHFGVGEIYRYLSDIISFGFGFLSMVRGGQGLQEDKDEEFYNLLKEKFKDKLKT